MISFQCCCESVGIRKCKMNRHLTRARKILSSALGEREADLKMNEELKNNSWRKFCNVDPKESFKNSDFEVPKEMEFVEKIPENENEADDAGVQENLSYSLSFSDLDVDYVPSSFEISNEDNCNSQDSDIPVEILNFDTTSEAKDLEIVEKEKNMKQKKKYKKKAPERDNCYFCETEVLNFSRHIARCHSAEIEVQRLLAKPVKSKERKNLITSLRKKGNYLRNSEVCSKPMKKPPGGDTSEYLPCLYCLGFYSRKQLWRHKKRCTENPHLENNISSTSALYFKNHKTDPDLRDKVFPRMRPDKVSIVAQQDALICAFGSRYLRVHREKHFINVTSRKMRELSRLLIEAKKLDKSINTMMDMLQPKYYDTVVTATKLCAKYDKSTECFLSPTFAMNIATSLKQCCDLAIVFALKRKHIYATVSAANAESAIKTFAQLIEANWRYDISTVASNNLHIKRWNKITIIPLAKDLKLMKNYLTTEADKAKQKLSSENENKSAYKVLTETVYCRVLLLNRKRPGELQRLLIDLYNQSSKRQNYEEFSDAISPTEKILMNRFKRIVIRGKRNRGVPVLFSTEVQKDISIMNEIRHKYVREENRFLFALPDSDSHIVGYKVLAKYAKACGAERHDALTSTRLRKHLATLSQIFSMTDSDLEQLSTFMGHTPGTHKNSYRLPDDVYQSSKIVKILLLMEQGTSASFKGKTLDEIEVDLEQNLEDELEPDEDAIPSDVNDDINMDYETLERSSRQINIERREESENENQKDEVLKRKNKRKNNKIQRTPWTEEQKKVVKEFFQTNIRNKVPPKRIECEKLISQNNELLKNKDWLKIKVFIQNVYTLKCKG